MPALNLPIPEVSQRGISLPERYYVKDGDKSRARGEEYVEQLAKTFELVAADAGRMVSARSRCEIG